jgi:hypothetical protein
MIHVLICDDEYDRSQRMVEALTQMLTRNEEITVSSLKREEFVEAITGLERRQKAARLNPAECGPEMTESSQAEDGHPFDHADILLLDYDLLKLTDGGAYAGGAGSGERLAYLSRCYSRCGVIVTYNQYFYGRTFDLTLRGHLRSFADLNLSSDSITNRGLWSDDFEGFRPWSWPLLMDSVGRLRRCTDVLASQPERPILGIVGLADGPACRLLTRELLDFLDVTEPPEIADVNQFVHHSGNGLRFKDRLWEPRAAFRIASARVSKWLERGILPGQNIIVDGPHLVDRFPSVVTGDASEESWNRSCALSRGVTDLGIDAALIEHSRFPASDWLSRPTWIWPTLARSEAVREVADPWGQSEESLVFCEDAARFHRRDVVREFVAEVKSEFARRYVRGFADVQYEPVTSFLV